ncbi:MAG TPA: DUF456 family protein [Usitatibacter sp.]|jgi:uncharacterized protein|nr:DUF456 family protein [Usitatibacter sp.]
MDASAIYVFAVVLVILGLVGTVVPVLPGVLLVFGGLFMGAYADGFQRVGVVGMTIIGALGLLSLGADLLGTALGAKRLGASPQALLGATLGGAAGFLFGIPGLLIGPFLGAAYGEYMARGKLLRAGKVGLGTWLGLLLAAIAKVVIAFLMIAVFFAIRALA